MNSAQRILGAGETKSRNDSQTICVASHLDFEQSAERVDECRVIVCSPLLSFVFGKRSVNDGDDSDVQLVQIAKACPSRPDKSGNICDGKHDKNKQHPAHERIFTLREILPEDVCDSHTSFAFAVMITPFSVAARKKTR